MQIYKVGGAVRDELLGYPHHETDWVVVGSTPKVMLDAGFSQVGKDFPVFLHPKTKEEYALARTERKSGHGYHGFEVHADPSVTLEEDLERRDLTINAMAMTESGDVIDPYGGQRDLVSKTLRHVSPHFAEDPLRLLRVARFAARYHHLGFSVAAETLDLMTQIVAAGEIEHLSIERIWVETERALGERNPEVYFQVLQSCGAMARLLPAVLVTQGIDRLATARAVSPEPTVRWAALLCELPATRAEQACDRLKAPKSYRELASKVSEWRPKLKSALREPALCMALLQGLDALRRDEPFAGFCEAVAALDGERASEHVSTQLLHQAHKAVVSIRAAQLADSGLHGPELGKALTALRVQALAQVLAA